MWWALGTHIHMNKRTDAIVWWVIVCLITLIASTIGQCFASKVVRWLWTQALEQNIMPRHCESNSVDHNNIMERWPLLCLAPVNGKLTRSRRDEEAPLHVYHMGWISWHQHLKKGNVLSQDYEINWWISSLPEAKQCDYHKKGHSTSLKGISKIQKMK
jgi:hypothetical protein